MGEILRLTFAATILFTAALSLAANPAQAEAEADGAALYKKNCLMCHGQDGKGFAMLKTPDMTSPEWQKNHDDKKLTESIRAGKKPMPPFPPEKLSDEELKAVIAHIRSFNSKKEK